MASASSPKKKIITVVGGTGNQGSSVARTFLNLRNWHVRCLTRNPSSVAAQNLHQAGAELVQGDLDNPASLATAFKDANVIFLNTDFWAVYREAEGKDPTLASKQAFEVETTHAKNAIDAAAAVPSLERFVYSALASIQIGSNGKHALSLHWEAKAWPVAYLEREQPALAKKASFIYLGAYADNKFLDPTLDPESKKYTLVVPELKKDTKLPIIDPKESTGPFVRALIEDEDAGAKLLAYDSYLTMEEIVKAWSNASGKECGFATISMETAHEKTGLSYELLEAPAFIAEFGYMAGIDGFIEPSQLKNKPETTPFEEWLKGRNWKEMLAN